MDRLETIHIHSRYGAGNSRRSVVAIEKAYELLMNLHFWNRAFWNRAFLAQNFIKLPNLSGGKVGLGFARAENISLMTRRKARFAVPALVLGLAFLAPGYGVAAGDVLPPAPAAPAAHLAPERVSAAADGQAILTVDAPGRFSIVSESQSGIGLQLVDMITGPGEVVGQAGARDGRMDLLLDKGTYKIRTFGIDQAKGDARLSVRAFREVGPLSNALLRGGAVSTELKDLNQRSYWILVDKSGSLFVEAAGRALADLRLWRNGTDLVELDPVMTTIEPTKGHPLLDARLEGHVTPGLYLATAYGGEALPWADGASALPLHLRAGPAATLVASTADGVIGPFGSVRYRVAPAADFPGVSLPPEVLLRLELQEPAPIRLTASRADVAAESVTIAKNSREPVAELTMPGNSREPGSVEVTGTEGQTFRLRVMRPTSTNWFDVAASGPHLVAVEVAGEGGDEPPASFVLAAFDKDNKTRSLISTAPQIGPGKGWRGRFNLRGTTELLFEVTGAGPLEVRSQGPDVAVSLENLLGGRQRINHLDSQWMSYDRSKDRADGGLLRQFDLEPSWYRLRIKPAKDASGILDLTFAPHDVQPDAAPSTPHRAIPLGVFDLAQTEHYQLFATTAPGLTTALDVHVLPLDLTHGAVAIVQGSLSRTEAAKLDIPVRVPPGGVVTAIDSAGHLIPITLANDSSTKDGRTLTVRLAPAERPREVVLAWSSGVSEPVPQITPDKLEVLAAGKPHFFDLARDQQRDFLFDVPDGGLYRVETLGRLKTSATVATSFVSSLSTAADNGAGHNALVQTFLRTGQYHVRVSALESAGHVGVVASPGLFVDGGPLAVDNSARASLAEGRGATFTIDIAEAGLYRLDLYGLGQNPTVRLEDMEGWPLTAPGATQRIEQRFAAGRYRLVVLPSPVDTRVVARLTRIINPTEPQGHGPHPLPFDVAQKFQWREPAAKDAERVPDRWEFELAGDANIALNISDGMIADLIRVDGDARSVAKLVFPRGYSGKLAAGRYRIEARALGRNDRFDYELNLRSTEVQPNTPRVVTLPATVPFSIARDRVVNLTTFGWSQLAGVLKDESGQVIERLGPRTDDWNIALSRRLRAGAYRLELKRTASDMEPAAEAADSASAPVEGEQSEGEPSEDEQESRRQEQTVSGKVEVRFDLPEASQVREVPLPDAAAGNLMVVAAQSSSELAVSLEREDENQTFAPVGNERGRSPVVAAFADGDRKHRWRALVWRVDGGVAPIAVATRAVATEAQPLGTVKFVPVDLEGITPPLVIAHVVAPSATLVSLAGATPGLRLGSAPGQVLAKKADGLISPQSDQVWLIGRGGAPRSLTLQAVPAALGEIVLSLATGERALVKSGPIAAGHLRAWRVDSGQGQPGLAAGSASGVADASAFSVGTSDTATVWSASGEPLQVRVTSTDIAVRAPLTLDTQFSTVLPARTAQPLTLAAAGGQVELGVELGLAAGTAAVVGSSSTRPITVWSGRVPVSRQAPLLTVGQATSLAQDDQKPLKLTVDIKGKVFINDAEVELNELVPKLKAITDARGGMDERILISADKKADYGTVAKVMGLLSDAGFKRLALANEADVVLVNPGDQPAAVSVTLAPPISDGGRLATGQAFKRFFGAAGSLSLLIDGEAGDRLTVAGAKATFVDDRGGVQRGRSFVIGGPGELVLDHPVGLVAAWLERDGKSPWRTPAPIALTPPQSVSLSGEAMTFFVLKQDTPVLLHVRTSAPVIAALDLGQNLGQGSEPTLYPAGAELHQYVPAGSATLRLYSPHDGPLAGTLTLTATPVTPIAEGLGEERTLAPGSTALFGFELTRAAEIGVGVRSVPDLASVRLLDAAGRSLGEGIAQLHRLPAGRYLLEAKAPADGGPMIVRPALVGLTPRPAGPPPEVAKEYLEMVGLKPAAPQAGSARQ